MAPARIGARITASFAKKAHLRRWLEKWRGAPFASEDEAHSFDLGKLIGQPALLFVTHAHARTGDRVYANIDNIIAWPKGKERPAIPKDTLFFHLGDHPLSTIENRCPKFLLERIKLREADNWEDYNAKTKAHKEPAEPDADHYGDSDAGGAAFDDDIPF
jgi:hypothetical protein